MPSRLLYQHLQHIVQQLKTYYVRADIAKHGDVKGFAREGFVKLVLQEFLPPLVAYGTGEIIDEKDSRSGQVDLILQSVLAPRLTLFDALNVALIDSVLAVIEVKSTLSTAGYDNPSHLKSALDTFAKVKSLKRLYKIRGTPSWKTEGPLELPNTPCFLFAFDGPSMVTLRDKLNEYGASKNLNPNLYWPEVVVVLNQNYSMLALDGWLYRPNELQLAVDEGEEKCLVHLLAYLTRLIETWYVTTRPTPFANYLREANE